MARIWFCDNINFCEIRGESIKMVDSKQFIISDEKIEMGKRWNTIKMKSGKYLSWEDSIHISMNATKNAILLGDAWQVGGGKPQIQ